jgi:ABC-2 type transport system permease protein
MKKKFFDKSLMVEGLSQLKLPGFIFLIISVLGSALPAIFGWINYHSACVREGFGSLAAQEAKIVYISGVTPILLPIIYLAPFVFCLTLFSFLNKRKGSDFYHSLSATRVNIFLSFTVSTFIWIAIIVLSSVLTASFIYAISGMTFNPVFIPYLIFTFFAAAILVTACMLFAMSITGTTLTNIIMFGMILFLPRFITTLSVQNMVNSYPIISPDAGGIINVQNNIPVSFIFRNFLGYQFSNIQLYTSISAIIYTLILAIIYIAIACLLFNHRKSELAGSGAPSRVLQHIFRCIVTLPLALLIPLLITNSNYNNSSSFWRSNMPTIITIAIISIFIYFLYELLTTKSAKNMIRSAPVLIVVVAICAVFGLSLNYAKNSVLNFSPSSSEIESISVVQYDYNYSSRNINYSGLLQKDVQFNDDTTKNSVSKILSDNVSRLKSGTSLYNSGRATNYKVGIKLKNGKYAERILYADDNQSSDIQNSMKASSKYLNAITQLPPEENNVNVSYLSDQVSIKKLWDTFKSEYTTLSENDKESIYSYTYRYYNGSDNYKEISIASFTVNGNIGIDNYTQEYPITLKMPKTAAMYAEMLNAKNKSAVKALMTAYNGKGNSYSSVGITLYNDTELSEKPVPDIELANFNMYDSNNSHDNITRCFNILLSQFDDQVDLTKPYVAVYFNVNEKSYSYYQALSNDNAKAIYDLNLKRNM